MGKEGEVIFTEAAIQQVGDELDQYAAMINEICHATGLSMWDIIPQLKAGPRFRELVAEGINRYQAYMIAMMEAMKEFIEGV